MGFTYHPESHWNGDLTGLRGKVVTSSAGTADAKMLESTLARAGDVLFRKGDSANAMFFVMSGRYHDAEIGVDLLPGEVVGELALLSPDQLRTQTLACTENEEVLQITYDQVRQLYYQNPQFAFYFLQLSTQRLFQNIAQLESELAKCKAASVPTVTA
jgi:CRP/FNR family transcriptional regulator, cyclic AMP receptor protein